ncbi:MAG: adenylate/guanylate cyclase domain-containing protein [Acidimicrobiales bacterium]
MASPSKGSPRGRVTTFLMGDLVGSTAHWLSSPVEMEAALRFHDAVVGDAVSASEGEVFKHTGDGFLARFDDPDEAIAAARRIRGGLASAPDAVLPLLRVRLAVDLGWAVERDGDWFGPAVNRVARVTDLVEPAGVVVTSSVVEVVRAAVDPVDLGEVDLRSHTTGIRLYGIDGAMLSGGPVPGARLCRGRGRASSAETTRCAGSANSWPSIRW